MSDTLHVVHTDVLLWVLGGFEEPPADAPGPGTLPSAYVAELMRLATAPKNSIGDVTVVAERFGRSVDSAYTLICRCRRGIVPGYWRDAA